MTLLRHDEVRRYVIEAVFREPPALAVLNFVAMAAIAAVSMAGPWFAGAWWFGLLFVPLWLLVLPTLLGATRAAFTDENWVAKTTPEGLLLHLRSYRNRHFPRDVETVAFVPWNDVAMISGVVERRTTPGSRPGGTEMRWQRFLEIQLESDDTDALRQALAADRERRAPKRGISRTRHHHYPVTVTAPGVIRVEFGGVRPSLRRALEILRFKVAVDSQIRRRKSDWERMEAAELDRFVGRLYTEGDVFGAIRIVRARYDVPLAEAKDYARKLACVFRPS